MSFTTNVQWKGTDICMDFNCPKCGAFSHFDGYFHHYIQCAACEQIYRMPTDLPIEAVDSVPPNHCQPKRGEL